MTVRFDRGRALRRVMGFLAAGAVGFCVDAGVLKLGLAVGLPAWGARVPSFALAVLATWTINRRLTFSVAAPPSLSEFRAYLSAMSLGLVANYVLYLAGLRLGLSPVAALAVAAVLAMAVNFVGAQVVLGRSGRS
jgi:putative flippase GtrA